jgi:hypothetical protein
VDRAKALASLLVAVALVSVVLVSQADLALHKAFWLDEGHEVVRTCAQSAGTQLIRGSHECSPAPLYWMAQSTVLRNVEPLGLSLRLEYRAVSLAAAALTLLVLLLGLQGRLGLAAALIAPATLLTDPGFHFYAAQNRAYMTWVAVTSVLVVAAAAAAVRPREQLRWAIPALLGAGLLAGLAALPGCLQAGLAFAGVWAARLLTRGEGGLARRHLAWLAVGALAIVAMDAYYWSGSPCRDYKGSQPYGLDLVLASDRGRMIRHAATVLVPLGTSPLVLLGHAALAAGLLTPALLWRRRRELDDAERYAFALALIAGAQILVAIPVGAGLAAGRYLFIPRMFIFATVARAVLTAIGFWWAARALQRVTAQPLGRWAAALPLAVAGATTAAAVWQGDAIARGLQLPLGPAAAGDCASLRVPVLHLWEPADRSLEFTPNALVRLGRSLEACAATPVTPGPPRHLIVLSTEPTQDWFRVQDEPPADFKPLQVCGRAVVVESGRARTVP